MTPFLWLFPVAFGCSSGGCPASGFSPSGFSDLLGGRQVYYVTVASRSHPVLDVLKKTVAARGLELIVIGQDMTHVNYDWMWGDPTNTTIIKHGHLGLKLMALQKFFNNPNFHPDDVVIYTDAFDVCFVGDVETVIKRYLALKKPVIFGAEEVCWPEGAVCQQIPRRNRLYGLNSGVVVGRVGALKSLMQGDDLVEKINDQEYWTEKYIKNQDIIGLDHERDLFLNLAPLPGNPDVWDRQMKWSPTGPFMWKDKTVQFVHGNGAVTEEEKVRRVRMPLKFLQERLP